MQILGSIFYILFFVSVIGSFFTVLSLFVTHVLHITLPLWFSLFGMIFFCFPFLSPDVFLFSPEPQEWLDGFSISCLLWVCGCVVFLVCDVIRSALAKQAVKNYHLCNDTRISELCSRCAATLGLKKTPALYWGTLDQPVCVAGIIRPVIIMNQSVITQLNDKELSAVFFHELTHIMRKHILLERIYDYVCILHWFNPFSWLAKKDFSLHCETDCDDNAIRASQGKLTKTEYASAMIRLLELSSVSTVKSGKEIGALSFLLTKRRIKRITGKISKTRDRWISVALAVLLVLTAAFSMNFSREHFYPYPAYQTGPEYSTGYDR